MSKNRITNVEPKKWIRAHPKVFAERLRGIRKRNMEQIQDHNDYKGSATYNAIDRDDLLTMLDALINGLQAVQKLINESHGVDGLHLNGDPAPWESLQTGGEFESWLEPFDSAIAAMEQKE